MYCTMLIKHNKIRIISLIIVMVLVFQSKQTLASTTQVIIDGELEGWDNNGPDGIPDTLTYWDNMNHWVEGSPVYSYLPVGSTKVAYFDVKTTMNGYGIAQSLSGFSINALTGNSLKFRYASTSTSGIFQIKITATYGGETQILVLYYTTENPTGHQTCDTSVSNQVECYYKAGDSYSSVYVTKTLNIFQIWDSFSEFNNNAGIARIEFSIHRNIPSTTSIGHIYLYLDYILLHKQDGGGSGGGGGGCSGEGGGGGPPILC